MCLCLSSDFTKCHVFRRNKIVLLRVLLDFIIESLNPKFPASQLDVGVLKLKCGVKDFENGINKLGGKSAQQNTIVLNNVGFVQEAFHIIRY